MILKWFLVILGLVLCILPWSIDISIPYLGAKIGLPLEFILIFGTILFIGYWIFRLKKYPFQLQSLETLVLLFIGWRILSSCFSELPMVAFKDTLAKIWFIVPAFFMGKQLFAQKEHEVLSILKISLFSMCLVVMVILWQRYTMPNFHVNLSWATVQPFFNDHTQYAAVLTLLLPLCMYFAWTSKRKWEKALFLIIFLIFIFALIVSLSRAALLGFIVAVGMLIIFLLRKYPRVLWISGGSFVVLLFAFVVWGRSNHIFDNYGVKKENPIENLLSITNFHKDVSSMERTNRWSCAVRMHLDDPVFGTGAGTFQFLYGPYQKTEDLTSISTFKGDGGNAHSEYLTALTETGTPGLFFFLILFSFGIGIGFILAGQLTIVNPLKAYLLLAISLGLITFMVHGVVNNFLNTDKVAVWVFLFLGIIDSVKGKKTILQL